MHASRMLAVGVLFFGCAAVADGQEPSPTTAVTAEFRAGLARHKIADAYAAHCKYAFGRFDASRGTATYSDKTGNCRLPWVEQLVTAPCESVDEVERFSRELFAAASQANPWAKLLAAAAVRLDVAEVSQPAAVAPTQDVLQQVAAVLAATRKSWEQALAPLTAAEQLELRAALYRQTTGELELGHRFVDQQQGRRVADLFDRIDRAQLWQTAHELSALAEPSLLDRLGKLATQTVPAKPGIQGALWNWVETPQGVIVVGGPEANQYALDELVGVAAVIDVRGDDTYVEGKVSAERPVLVVIDLAGNDTYRGAQPGIQGAAVLGASLLVDAAGDDRYSAVDIAQGSALAGVGILIDAAGSDKYVGDRRVQGQAVAGCGILLDRAGNDDYRAALLAQGVGGPRGFGMLADLAGEDHYFAGGKYPGGYDDTPGFGSWSQGVGVGPRGVANGGVGIIIDGGGDDVYEADYFSHGGGYWFAAGIARDFGGNDERIGATREHFDGSPRTEQRFVRWGTGYGCHFAAGFVLDDSGNDSYVADFAVIAYAWDIAIGAVCDWQGDDKYVSAGSGVAQAHNAAVALLYDRAGSDQYQGGVGATTKETPYHPEASGNYTLVLDDAGTDQYPPGVNNQQETDRGWPGARVVDR